MSARASLRPHSMPKRWRTRSPHPAMISLLPWCVMTATDTGSVGAWLRVDGISAPVSKATESNGPRHNSHSRRTCANTERPEPSTNNPSAQAFAKSTHRHVRQVLTCGPRSGNGSTPPVGGNTLSSCAKAPWRIGMSYPTEQIRFCTSRDGTRIAYGTCGAGPPLVFVAHWIHHLKMDWDSPVWRPWLTTLSKRHTLIRYDFRGCGLSDRKGCDFSFEAL